MEDLLDELTPEEMDERHAYYLLSGEGDARRMNGMIAAEVYNLLAGYVELKSRRKQKRASAEDFVPASMKRKRKQDVSIEVEGNPEAASQVASMMGFGHGN